MRRFFVSCALALALAMPSTPGRGQRVRAESFRPRELAGPDGRAQKTEAHRSLLEPCLCSMPDRASRVGEIPCRASGAPLVLVNWETRPQPEDRIRNTLAKSGLAGTEQWALADDFEQKIRFAIDRDWMESCRGRN